jgi:hypothetical protein
MNAYELANLIGLCGDGGYNQDAANMLRQQADLIRNLQKSLGFKNSGYETINLTPQTKPLSDEEILEMTIWNKNLYELYVEMEKEDMIAFARAIEERHGIK